MIFWESAIFGACISSNVIMNDYFNFSLAVPLVLFLGIATPVMS